MRDKKSPPALREALFLATCRSKNFASPISNMRSGFLILIASSYLSAPRC